MNGAVTFTDTLYLNAQDNADAVFVIKTNAGAMSTSTYSKVILINGAQAKNVYWKIDGALEINDYSIFKGTMIVNGGAVNIATGVNIEGRVLATVGDFHTSAITAISDADCGNSGIDMIDGEDAITVYPNPFENSLTIQMNNDVVVENSAFVLYTVLGQEIMRTDLVVSSTTIDSATIPSGVYFYKVIANNQTIQSGKLMAN
jgi:hypothetical protein